MGNGTCLGRQHSEVNLCRFQSADLAWEMYFSKQGKCREHDSLRLCCYFIASELGRPESFEEHPRT